MIFLTPLAISGDGIFFRLPSHLTTNNENDSHTKTFFGTKLVVKRQLQAWDEIGYDHKDHMVTGLEAFDLCIKIKSRCSCHCCCYCPDVLCHRYRVGRLHHLIPQESDELRFGAVSFHSIRLSTSCCHLSTFA